MSQNDPLFLTGDGGSEALGKMYKAYLHRSYHRRRCHRIPRRLHHMRIGQEHCTGEGRYEWPWRLPPRYPAHYNTLHCH